MFARASFRAATPLKHAFRSYSSQTSASPSTFTPWIVAGAAVGTGVFGYTYLGNKRNPVHAEAQAGDTSSSTKKAFTGGDQGFIALKLKEVQPYNHDTKKFIFALPEDDMTSGLPVACKWKPAAQMC